MSADSNQVRNSSSVGRERAFSEMLDDAIRRYQSRTIEAAKVIEELIAMAKDIRDAHKKGEELGVTDEELAFYDALANNESAKEVLGDDVLRTMAQVLVERVRKNVTVDWSVRESVRAKLRLLVKRILKKYGYPPDLQKAATDLVLEQAEKLSEKWVTAA